ncbi:MAG: DEAD/DEAH box helicase family protein, partial [bacterium]|nr:DEAD/DEAH box helicase family protein [bacterium]
MQHHWLNWDELKSQFPKGEIYKDGMRAEQEAAFRFIAKHGSSVHELWTGVGKTEIAATLAKTAAKHFQKCVVTVPTKTIADQYRERFPDVFTLAFGRNDFPCFLYERDKTNLTRDSKTKFKADEIPYTVCKSCPHYVDQETGKVAEEGALACPYYLQSHQAKVSRKPVLTTFAFYLFKRLFSKDFPEPDLLVIDEGHRVPELVRSALSYDITDWHLEQAISILEKVEEHETAAALEHFRKRMIEIVRKKHRVLLDAEEIGALIKILETIDAHALARSVAKAIKSDAVEAEDNLEIFKKVEGVALNLRRYIRSLEFSLPLANRGALAYTYAYHETEKTKHQKTTDKLVVCSHYVAALVEKCLLGKTTIALSATIGDSAIFGQESGINFPFLSLPPSFPPENTAVYMPTDT